MERLEETGRICPHCGAANPPYELLCGRCSRSLVVETEPRGRHLLTVVGLMAGELLLVLLAFTAGILTAPLLRSSMPFIGAAEQPAPAATTQAPAVVTSPTPEPVQPTPTPRPEADGQTALPIGQTGRVGRWEIVVNGVEAGDSGRDISVSLSLRNAGQRAAALVLAPPEPLNVPILPWRELPFPQLLPPPKPASPGQVDRLTLLLHGDGSQQAAGTFFGAADTAYSFIAAPGDAIRVREVFHFNDNATSPLTLEALFEGGSALRFDLKRRAPQPASLRPTPAITAQAPAVVTLADDWTIEVQQVRRVSQRQLAVDLTVTNQSGQDRPVLATPQDAQGEHRDVFAVDGEGRLAWSDAENMPLLTVAAGEQRQLTWWLTIGEEAFNGPVRLTFISDWTQNHFVRVDAPVQPAAG